MKTSLTIILFLLVFSLNLRAQKNQSNFKLNLLTSFDFNVSKNEISAGSWGIGGIKYDKTNYRIGLNTEYGFTNYLSILSGIIYSNKDFTGAFVGSDASFVLPYPQKIELRFIEVPLAFKFYFNPQKIRFFGILGLNNQFNLAMEKSDNINQYINDNRYSIGAKFGGGIEYNINSKFAIQLSSNYNKGLSNSFKDSNYRLDYLSFGVGIVKSI